jgi:hypothetical protein
MNIEQNPYACFANQEIDWLPMDTEELYNENLKTKYYLLQKNNWIDQPFTYKFNSHGFRSDEFVDQASILFLGCSMTVGIGVPYDTTWAKIVANTLNLKCYNLGIGGSSNDAAFRFALTWLSKLKPSICVFCQTFSDRMEIYSGKNIISNIASILPEFYLGTWQSAEENKFLLAEKNKLAIQNICSTNNIKFVHANVKEFVAVDLARDLCHPGIKSNLQFKDLILSRIN